MAALFGIHVGNSSASLAIYKDEDRVDIVANDAGERVTPTVVQWTPTNCIVGRAAQLEQFRNTTCTVIRNKQLLNENISQSEFDGLKSKIAYKVNKAETNIKYELLLEGKQHHVSPREIVSFIFKKIYGIAEAAVGGNKEMNTVLCVPLYFSSKSIELIKDVATKAGFKVVQVIDEPCAAALGYNLAVEPEESLSYCLVYRVGGVSIDATILLIQDGMFSVLGSVHKHNLGGSLFTEKLSDFLATEFKRQYKTTDITERGKFKLLAAAENVKQILSIQNVAQCSAESIGGGYDLSCSVSRARFENIMLPFIPEMLAPITEVLNQTGLSVNQINKVIGCGGSLKIPKLQENICSLFPSAEALMNIAPDELIALGAAKQAGYCIKYENLPESLAIDTPALSYSLLLTVRQGDSNEGKSHLIPKNSSVPLRRRYNVPLSENNLSVDIDIPEKNNLNLGSVSLDELESNSTVTIELDINKDGKLLLNIVNEASSRKSCFKCDLKEMPIS